MCREYGAGRACQSEVDRDYGKGMVILMKKGRRGLALGLSAAMLLSLMGNGAEAQAAKKVKLSKNKLTMQVGQKTVLSLKNYTGKKKVAWSVNKKKAVKLMPKGKTKVQLTAKKAGKVKVTAKASGKKYTCVLTIKKKTTPQPSPSYIPTTTAPVTTAAVSEVPSMSSVPSASELVPTQTPEVEQTESPTPAPSADVTQKNKSNALLMGAESTSKKVQGISVYSKGTLHLVEVFGDFEDIQEIYDTISFQYATDDAAVVSEIYSPEAYFSDTTPGYYTLQVTGTRQGEPESQTYFLGRAGCFKYKVQEDKTVVIRDFEGWGEHLTVPDTLDGLPVSACGKEAFYHKAVGDIVLQEGMKELRGRSFYQAQMESVELPDDLAEVGKEAFRGCKNLTLLDLPSKLQSVGSNAFYKTPWFASLLPDEQGLLIVANTLLDGTAAQGTVQIPADVLCIAQAAFQKNKTIKGVEIPETVTAIPGNAFAQCSSLAAIAIPTGVKDFGGYAFAGTPWLDKQIKNSADEIVIVNDILIDGSYAEEGRLEIPDNVVGIAPHAFDGSEVTEITGMRNVTKIGKYAFSNCSVEEIELPEGLMQIDSYAFSGCDLQEITIPQGVTSLPEQVFSQCINLVSIQLPGQIQEIGKEAFSGCTLLSEITLPAALQTLGENAFYRCDSLAKVTFQGVQTEIADNAFYRCYNENLVFYMLDNSKALEFVKAKGYHYELFEYSD